MQQHALDALKPGVAWADVQRSTRLLMLEQLQQLELVVQGSVEGLMEAGVDRLFMPHGLGHFLGLDVHDVSDVGPIPQQLQEGQVITVEPGGCCVDEKGVGMVVLAMGQMGAVETCLVRIVDVAGVGAQFRAATRRAVFVAVGARCV